MEMRRRRLAKECDTVGEQDVQESTESIDDTSCSIRVVAKFAVVCLLTLYFTIPTLLYVFPQILEQIVFMNLVVGYAERTTLDRPTDSWGLSGAANFRVPCDGIELGVWHVLPASNNAHGYGLNNVASDEEITSQLAHAEKVMIYHHGNGMSRATGENGQRPALYRLLSKEGFHVIAFDYRGFGDSTGWPSESGLVNDSIAVYSWVRSRVDAETKIIFWGHSLGSSVATLATKHIFDRCQSANALTACQGPDSLILEGPFTNVRKGADDSSMSRLFSFIYPRFLLEWVIETGLVDRHIYLASDKSISWVKCPVLLLHADDDDIIPSRHSEELYQSCERSSNHDKMKVKFVKFQSKHGYGHMDIYKAPELPSIIKQFLDSDQDSGFEVSVF